MERSRVFLAQAFEELERGDLAQASEKGWGSAALITKAIAEERRWRHNSHSALHRIVDGLYRETSDLELRSLFGRANILHRNFYEDTYPASFIEGRLRDVERFVGRVEEMLGRSC